MNSQTLLVWVLGWSATATVASWLLRPHWQPLAVILCGAALIVIVSPVALLLLGVGTGATYLAVRSGPVSREVLISGVVIIAATFGFFLLRAQPELASTARGVVPFGLAFFALRLIHYLFESFKGTLRPHGLMEYAYYQFLPGTLAAGPIHRFDEFQRDIRRRRWDDSMLSLGFERILYGLVKIIVLSNYLLGMAATRALSEFDISGTALHTYLSTVISWAVLYLTFSGYSDVAIGFGLTMGLRLRENFQWPFLARNIADFWQRWHFSLSSWCRDYVFTPVLARTRRPGFAVVVSMIILGLWHEASLRYILWGAYHGAGIAAFRLFDAKGGSLVNSLHGWAGGCWRIIATLITLHFVMLSFVATTKLEALMAVH